MVTTFAELFEQLKGKGRTRVIVAGGEDPDALEAVEQSYKLGFGEAVLIGNRQKIDRALAAYPDRSFVKDILEADSEEEKARVAVETVKQGGVLLKGTTKTSILMKAALNKEWGLRTGAIMTSVAAFEDERDGNKKLVLMSDGGVVVAPDLNTLVAVINNCVEVAHKLGNPMPKVAILCAVEAVNPEMPETINAAILAKMNERGQIKGCIVDGPLALDNAVSKYAAEKKGLRSPVAGDADILIVP
ncbi:MAG: phosphate acyltransferase, partial [Candidatus Cryosericum sp.]